MPILPGSCLQWAQEMGWLWEVPSLPVKLAMHPLAPSVLGLRPKPPPSRREVLRRAAAVGACTVLMFSLPILLGNDTGQFQGIGKREYIIGSATRRRYRAGRRAAAVGACTVPMFSLPILLGKDTGRVREGTITDQLGAHCQRPLAAA